MKLGSIGALFVLFILLACEVYGDWMLDSDPRTNHAKQIVDNGTHVMMSLTNKLREKRLAYELAQNDKVTLFGLDLAACADMTSQIQNGETLLISGGVLFYDASNDYNKITDCYGLPTYQCWTQIIADIVPFIEKYKPLSECYIDNVYYTIQLLDHYFNLCIGKESNQPVAPDKTFEQCVRDIKINF